MVRRHDIVRITADWQDYEALDNVTRQPVCLTLRERRMLAMVAEYLGWQTRWENFTLSKQDAKAMVADIEYWLMADNCMKLRQSTTNSCLLEVTYDGGLTWQTAFDYSLCAGGGASSDVINLEQIFATEVTIIENNYYPSELIQDAFPDLERGLGNDADIDIATCFAMQQYIDMLCELAIENIENQVSLNNLIRVVSTVIAAAVGFLFGGAIGATIALTALAKYVASKGLWDVGVDPAPYKDTAARLKIACCLSDRLNLATMSMANWSNAGFSCGVLSANEQVIYDAWFDSRSSIRVFLGFAKMVDELIPVVQNVGLVCECNQWTQVFDFSLGAYANDWFIVDEGAYIPGQFYQATTFDEGGGLESTWVQIRTNKVVSLLHAEITYHIAPGQYENSSYVAVNLGEFSPPDDLVWYSFADAAKNVDTTYAWDGNQSLNGMRAYVRNHQNKPFSVGTSQIKKIVLTGTGVNPFDGTP